MEIKIMWYPIFFATMLIVLVSHPVPTYALSPPENLMFASIYYVRADGGTSVQCNGLRDLPYSPGSGIAQNCAWNHPWQAINADKSWKISPGDTLLIYPSAGGYRIGGDMENPWSFCVGYGGYGCATNPPPSGLDPAHPTRIYGVGYDTRTGTKPKFVGVEYQEQVLNLAGVNNIEVRWLELTDGSTCAFRHTNPDIEACDIAYPPPYGDFALRGIDVAGSSILIKDVDIHGLYVGITSDGGYWEDVTFEDVHIYNNQYAGMGENSLNAAKPSQGTITFRRVNVEYSGCVEDVNGNPGNCNGQYGDGFGSEETCGNWVFEDSKFNHNTSDGLDLLYVGKSDDAGVNICSGIPTSVNVTRSEFIGNAGNQLKAGSKVTVENSILEGNCSYFYENPIAPTYTGNGVQLDPLSHCRAGGQTIALAPYQGADMSIINNTISGEGTGQILVACTYGRDNCGTGTGGLTFLNNIVYPYDNWKGTVEGFSDTRTFFLWIQDTYFENIAANSVFNNNWYRSAYLEFSQDSGGVFPHSGGNIDTPPDATYFTGSNPGFADVGDSGRGTPPSDFSLVNGSQVIDRSSFVDSPAVDFTNTPRDSKPDLGALEFGSLYLVR